MRNFLTTVCLAIFLFGLPLLFLSCEMQEQSGKMVYWVNCLDQGIYAGAADGSYKERIASGNWPDGVTVDKVGRKIYFTNMIYLNPNEGSIQRCNLDGSNVEDVVPRGWGLKTPKQLQIDPLHLNVYFCDREGQRVYRAPMNGVKTSEDLEVLVDFTSLSVDEYQCVGIALDIPRGEFYWTDRLDKTIRRASMDAGSVITPDNVDTLTTLIVENALAPIDLYLDQDDRILYFTDRGEDNPRSTYPAGYVAKVNVDHPENGVIHIVENLTEDPIGIAVDESTGDLYFTTFDDGKVWKTTINGGTVTALYRNIRMACGMEFVDWDNTTGYSPIDPVAWDVPEAPPLDGAYTANDALLAATVIDDETVLDGPEDTAMDDQGRVYFGNADGTIQRLLTDGAIETFVYVGGHPLGMEFDASGNLIVCEPTQGLLKVTPDRQVSLLTNQSGGRLFRFADDVDIASDGMIYFSDASDKFTMYEDHLDMLEARPHGRLLRYNPQTGTTETLVDGLYFANGVALSQNEDFVIVNETYRYRITRYWLKGPKAGTSELFADNLPGIPDGVSSNRQGMFWVAFFSVRNSLMDTIHSYPAIKKMMANTMSREMIYSLADPYGFVVGMDENGNAVVSYQDPTGEHLGPITSATQYGNDLYLGTVTGHKVGIFELP